MPFTAEQLWEELGGLQVDLACADREAMRQINQHRSPTARQATWLRRGAQNALLLAAAGEAVRHSPLAGSRDMERWGAQAAGSVQNFMWEHLVVPASQIRKELQRTFRSNKVGGQGVGGEGGGDGGTCGIWFVPCYPFCSHRHHHWTVGPI